jgi:tetratricopeptide (TPR) repeat protein
MPRFRRLSAALAVLALLAACESTADRIAGHLAKGRELVAAGEDAKARLEFANAVRLDPENIAAHVELAQIFERAGDIEATIRHLNRIIDLDAANVWALTRLARLALAADQLDIAREKAAAALAAGPTDPDALATRAAVEWALGNAEAALADARRAVEADPANPVAGGVLIRERAGAADWPAALALADRFLAAHPADLGLNRLRLGVLSGMDDTAGVGAQLARMTELVPDDIEAWAGLVQWTVANGTAAEAFARLRDRTARPGDSPFVADALAALVRALAVHLQETAGVAAARAELVRFGETAAEPFRYVMMLAEFDYATGRQAEAKAALEAALADPARSEDAVAARVLLARFLVAEGDRAGARARLDAAIAADASDAAALGVRAALSLEEGAAEAALADLRAALAARPRDPFLLGLSGEANERAGNAALAGEAYAAAMQASDYGTAETLRYAGFLDAAGRTEAAETVLAEAVHRRPGERALLVRLAELRLRLGRLVEAEAVAEQIRRIDGAAGTADQIRAAALSGQGRHAESVAILERLAAEPAARETAMASLVRAYVQAGTPERAEAFLAGILADNPANVRALYLMARLREEAGDPAAAEARLREIVLAEPGLERSHEALADFLMRQGRVADAEAAVEAGLAAVPGATLLTLRRAGFRESRGEIDRAIADYEAMLAAEPGSLVAVNNLVSLLTDHYAEDAAKLERARAIAGPLRGSTVPQLQDTYGWLLYLSGDYAGAAASLGPAAAALPDNAWVRYHYGMTLAKLGQAGPAREHLEAALRLAGEGLFPPRERAQAALAALAGG